MSYLEAYHHSLVRPEAYWSKAAHEIRWDRPYEHVHMDGRWFVGGRLNTCYNCLDRHVDEGRGDRPALIYDSPVTGTVRAYSYLELRDLVARFAGALQALGVGRGDRVLVYMPMTPEAVIAMLACARLGAVHSVVFGGFASQELAVRIEDARPKVLVTASCGIEVKKVVEYKPLLDQALAQSSHQPERCVVLQRPQHRCSMVAGRDLEWEEVMASALPAECLSVAATDPLYILYTSGTTGKPKGVVRDNGGHAVALRLSMQQVYGAAPGEVFWAASDIGWAVGHSYIVYAPLLYGCTTLLHEGKPVGTPDAGNFWRVIAQHGVRTLFTAPTAIRAIKREDPAGDMRRAHDLSCLRALFLAGERLDPDTYHWVKSLLGCPVIDHWWQTETGWPVAANCMGLGLLPTKPGSPTRPVPGFEVEILDQNGQPIPAEQDGLVALKLPLPPGCFVTLWEDEERFRESYFSRFPGYYLTGDGGYLDDDGYLFIMGRIDDVIIVSGHNLSTGSIEEAVASHPDVAECAVFGVRDSLRTQLPVGLIVLKSGVDRGVPDVVAEVVELVRGKVGPVANFKSVAVVSRLPKTRSGKILRQTLRQIADAEDFKTPSTIEDPSVLDEIRLVLQGLGYARST